MALIHWIGGTDNSFNTATDWDSATVPGSGDDVIIALAGATVPSDRTYSPSRWSTTTR